MSLDTILYQVPYSNGVFSWSRAGAATLANVIQTAYSAHMSTTCSTAQRSLSDRVMWFCHDRKAPVLALVNAAIPSPEDAKAWRTALAYFISTETDSNTLYAVLKALRTRLTAQPQLWGALPANFLGLWPAPFGPSSFDYARHPNPLAAVVSAVSFGYGKQFPATDIPDARLPALNLMQDLVSLLGRSITPNDLMYIVKLAEGTLLDPAEVDMWPWGRQVMNAVSALARSVLAQSQIKIAETTAPPAPPPPPPKLPPTWLQGNGYFYAAAGLVVVMLGGSFWLSKDRIVRRL